MEAAKRVPLAIIRITPLTVLKIESCFVRISCTCITDVHIILIFNNLGGKIPAVYIFMLPKMIFVSARFGVFLLSDKM